MLTPEFEARIMDALTQIKYSSFLNGDMGVCIFFFKKGKEENNPKFTSEAENILTRIIEEIGSNPRFDITTGITGIAIGISYLVKNKYVEGDINEILSEVDAKIYKKFCLKTNFGGYSEMKLPLTDILLYYIIRYEETKSENMKELQKRIISDLINWIYIHRDSSFYDEPFPFSLTEYKICTYLYELGLLYSRGFEKERIIHILLEMEYYLFSRYPTLHSNRLMLTTAVAYVSDKTGLEEWKEYAINLRRSINLNHIYEQEMFDKNIFPINGLIGIWLTAEFYNNIEGFEPIHLEKKFYIQRIINSSAWERMTYDNDFTMKYYAIDGYCGVRLFLDYLNKH